MFYEFRFWFRQLAGIVRVYPSGATYEYNGQLRSLDDAEYDIATAIFTARMQARPLRSERRAVILR